jgi:hypothetical protein
MATKPLTGGWVVQVRMPVPGTASHSLYFKVAIKSAPEAVSAAVRKSGLVGAVGFTMRRLTPEEVAAAGLKIGDAIPA